MLILLMIFIYYICKILLRHHSISKNLVCLNSLLLSLLIPEEKVSLNVFKKWGMFKQEEGSYRIWGFSEHGSHITRSLLFKYYQWNVLIFREQTVLPMFLIYFHSLSYFQFFSLFSYLLPLFLLAQSFTFVSFPTYLNSRSVIFLSFSFLFFDEQRQREREKESEISCF